MVTVSFLSFSFAGKLKACLTCVTTSVVFPDALPSNFSKAFTTFIEFHKHSKELDITK